VKLLSPGPSRPAQALVDCACREAASLSFEVGVEQLGISLESVRDELEERFGDGARTPACRTPISPEAKRILERAARRRRHVTPDQLLAALVEHSPRACRLLFELGVPVGTLRERLRC
jgi:hypothetical protein